MKRVFFIAILFGALFFQLNVASAQSGTPAIHVSKVTGNVGDVVDVTVSLVNNPGIVTMKLNVAYTSSVLKLVGVTDAEKLGDAMHPTRPQELTKNPYPLSWFTMLPKTDFTGNGVVATLHFELLAEANNSPITISYEPGNIRNIINEMITFEVVNGSVTATALQLCKMGDINCDGQVDSIDLNILISNYGKSGDAISNPAADLNKDRQVDSIDLNLLISNYGK